MTRLSDDRLSELLESVSVDHRGNAVTIETDELADILIELSERRQSSRPMGSSGKGGSER